MIWWPYSICSVTSDPLLSTRARCCNFKQHVASDGLKLRSFSEISTEGVAQGVFHHILYAGWRGWPSWGSALDGITLGLMKWFETTVSTSQVRCTENTGRVQSVKSLGGNWSHIRTNDLEHRNLKHKCLKLGMCSVKCCYRSKSLQKTLEMLSWPICQILEVQRVLRNTQKFDRFAMLNMAIFKDMSDGLESLVCPRLEAFWMLPPKAFVQEWGEISRDIGYAWHTPDVLIIGGPFSKSWAEPAQLVRARLSSILCLRLLVSCYVQMKFFWGRFWNGALISSYLTLPWHRHPQGGSEDKICPKTKQS